MSLSTETLPDVRLLQADAAHRYHRTGGATVTLWVQDAGWYVPHAGTTGYHASAGTVFVLNDLHAPDIQRVVPLADFDSLAAAHLIFCSTGTVLTIKLKASALLYLLPTKQQWERARYLPDLLAVMAAAGNLPL